MSFINRLLFIQFALLLFGLNQSFSQEEKCESDYFSFQAGEKLSYVLSYNWFVVFSEVGLVDFTINESTKRGQEVFHFHANGRTFNWWDKIFKVRDTYETWVTKDKLRPLYFERNTREGDYKQVEKYAFIEDSLVYRKNKTYENPYSFDTIPINACSFDVMSAILFTRNIDYSKFNIGDEIPITVVLDEKPYKVYFQYLGIEEKKVKNLGTFECLKFTLQLIEGTLFREGEDMILWVTNDKNHIPVFIESPIVIGSVKGRLTSIEGNRHPLTSKK